MGNIKNRFCFKAEKNEGGKNGGQEIKDFGSKART